MIVEIPLIEQHEGLSLNVGKVEISDFCPKCGRLRGKVYRTRSYDGSRFVVCDGWINPCGHIDIYKDCVQEAKKRSEDLDRIVSDMEEEAGEDL